MLMIIDISVFIALIKHIGNLDILNNFPPVLLIVPGLIESKNLISTLAIFFANVLKDESVQFIAKSNCSCSAGDCVKKASIACSGNGGGSPTFAQGGGKDISSLGIVLKDIQEEIERHA